MIVFSLNIIIGFACAIGIDMSFNTSHHHEEVSEVAEAQHDHEEHHHQGPSAHHHDDKEHHDNASGENDDNCCNHHVVDLSQLDKAIPQTLKVAFNPSPLLITPIYTYFSSQYESGYTRSTKFFVRSHHPPIPDIRIAIQSFQI